MPRSTYFVSTRRISLYAAIRVLEREGELAARIQARWRGLSVRKYLLVFRREIRVRRELRAGMTLRIQRTVRAWLHRKCALVRRSMRAAEATLREYQSEGDTRGSTRLMTGLLNAYILER